MLGVGPPKTKDKHPIHLVFLVIQGASTSPGRAAAGGDEQLFDAEVSTRLMHMSTVVCSEGQWKCVFLIETLKFHQVMRNLKHLSFSS